MSRKLIATYGGERECKRGRGEVQICYFEDDRSERACCFSGMCDRIGTSERSEGVEVRGLFAYVVAGVLCRGDPTPEDGREMVVGGRKEGAEAKGRDEEGEKSNH